jgi:predicted permease
MGGALGLVVALWLADAFSTLHVPLPVSLQVDLRLDWRVLLYAVSLSIATGILFGLAPALKAARRDIVATIKDDAPSFVTERKRFSLRNILVTGQVAVSIILLVAGGLFIRAFGSGLQVDPGFETKHTAMAAVDLEAGGYQEEPAGRAFLDRYFARISSLPGVQAAALASRVPFGLWGNRKVNARVPGQHVESNEQIPNIDFAAVTRDYFAVMDIPILQGRNFTPADTGPAPRVGIVSETMARKFWGTANPLGKTILLGRIGREEPIEVVGLARDVSLGLDSIRGESIPFLYLPFAQSYSADVTVIARTYDNPGGLPEMMRRELRDLDPRVPVMESGTMKDHLRTSFFLHRVMAAFLSAFGILTLVLAAIGLYGLVAFSVTQRTREMGIRIALGARPVQVVRLVLSQGLWLIAGGLLFGLPAAGLVMVPLSKALLGVSVLDPLTFGAVALLLAAVAVLAGYLPARRATRMDPMTALRNE